MLPLPMVAATKLTLDQQSMQDALNELLEANANSVISSLNDYGSDEAKKLYATEQQFKHYFLEKLSELSELYEALREKQDSIDELQL